MADSPFTPDQVRTLLKDEQGGMLPDNVKAELAELRGQKLFPPALGTPFQQLMGKVKREIAEYQPPVPEEDVPEADIIPGAAPRSAAPLIRKGVAAALPANEPEALAMIGTGLGAGAAAKLGLSPLSTALARIFGAGVGAEAGGLIAGKQLGESAPVAMAGAAVGELGVAGASAGLRKVAGARERIAGKMAAEMGETAEAASPSLGGARTAEELAKLAKEFDRGKKMLGDNFEQNITWAEQRLTQLQNARYPLPATAASGGPGSRSFQTGIELAEHRGRLVTGELTEFNPGPVIHAPALSDQPLTLREASELMKAPGLTGFGGAKQDPVARTVAAKPTRDQWTQGIEQIHQEVNRIDPSGQTWAVLRQGAEDYRIGMVLLPLLRSERVYTQTPDGLMLDRAGLQELVFKQWGKLKDRLPAGDLAALQDMLGWSGGSWGGKDIVPSGEGRASDALRQLMASGGGTGTLAVLGPRTVMPNAAARYVGTRQPYEAGAGIKTMADLLGVSVAEKARGGGW